MKKFFGTLWSVLRYILIYFGCSILTGIGLGIYYMSKFHLDRTRTNEAILNMGILSLGFMSLLSLIFFLIVIKVCHKSINGFLQFRKISSKDTFHCIGITTAYSFFSISLINLLSGLFPSYSEVNTTIQSSLFTIIGILLVTILIPVFEEIFFRGIIFNELRSRINLIAAIVLQALIFGVFHGNILQGIYTFLLGILMSLAYTWTRSLWANITMHISYNILGTLIVPIILYFTRSFIVEYLIFGGVITVALTITLYNRKKEENESKKILIITEEAYNNING